MDVTTTVVTMTIPSDWIRDINQDDLREALYIGLAQLRRQRGDPQIAAQVAQALLRTGRVAHLSRSSAADKTSPADRQPPPTIAGMTVSDILIAQRRGEL